MNATADVRTTLIDVPDMSCGHCVSHIEKALREVEGVRDVEVSLESKTAQVTSGPGVAAASLEMAISEAGYTAVNTRSVR
jgi:copper ion binding protein